MQSGSPSSKHSLAQVDLRISRPGLNAHGPSLFALLDGLLCQSWPKRCKAGLKGAALVFRPDGGFMKLLNHPPELEDQLISIFCGFFSSGCV